MDVVIKPNQDTYWIICNSEENIYRYDLTQSGGETTSGLLTDSNNRELFTDVNLWIARLLELGLDVPEEYIEE